MTAPLCDAGRCAQLLAGLAEAKKRLIEGQGAQMAAVLRAVVDDPEFAASEAQRSAWPALLARHVAAITGGGG